MHEKKSGMRVPVSQGENKVFFLKVSFGDRLHIFEYKFAYTGRDQYWYVCYNIYVVNGLCNDMEQLYW